MAASFGLILPLSTSSARRSYAASPPATARNLVCNLRQELIFSLLAGLLGGVGGVLASYQFDLPCGPSIVLTCIALFAVSLAIGQFRRPATR